MFDKAMARGSMVAVITTALISVQSVGSVARAQVVLSLTSAGAGSVTIPVGYEWTNVTVQCWGGGGGGGGYGPQYTSGGGGGGGAYASNAYATLLSGTYDYLIGAGGGVGDDEVNGGNGGNTIWNYGGSQDIYVTGGGGDVYNGGSGIGGLVLAGMGYSGGEGGNGYGGYGPGGGGGGSAGPSGPGGAGGDGGSYVGGFGGTGYGVGGNGGNSDGPGVAGSVPGGGGGGAGGGKVGAQGANGEIVITYTSEAVPEPGSLTLLGTALFGLGAAYLWLMKSRTAKPTAFDQPPAILSFPAHSAPVSMARRAA